MPMTDEERARRAPWGRVEEATIDASRTLYEALEGLPEGEDAEVLESMFRYIDGVLNDAAEVAIQAVHRDR